MSVVQELRTAIAEIPDQVAELLRAEVATDDLPSSDAAGGMFGMQTAIQALADAVSKQSEPEPVDMASLLELSKDRGVDLSSGLQEITRDEVADGSMPFSREGDELSRMAGSVHSQELDVLDSPNSGAIEILTRIAEGIQELVEQSRGSGGSRGGGGFGGGGPLPVKQDVGWNMMRGSSGGWSAASPSINDDSPKSVRWRKGMAPPLRRTEGEEDD